MYKTLEHSNSHILLKVSLEKICYTTIIITLMLSVIQMHIGLGHCLIRDPPLNIMSLLATI